MSYTLYHGDCLVEMDRIESGSVDAIICDLPYQTTNCHWDKMIPFEPLWKHYKRVIKRNGAIVLTASSPFNYALWASNPQWFKYEWIWDKKIPSGMSYARFQPMRQHEFVMLFSDKTALYNPQMVKRDKPIKEGGKKPSDSAPIANFRYMGGKVYTEKNPISILPFEKIRQGTLHPTQKPVALLEYLIKTYTNEGELVLDNTAGSFSTGEAALRTGRRFIGIEKDDNYFEIGKARMERVAKELTNQDLPLFMGVVV